MSHDLRGIQPSWRDVGQYVALCACGWQSRPTPMAEVARALHGEHLAYLVEGPTVVR